MGIKFEEVHRRPGEIRVGLQTTRPNWKTDSGWSTIPSLNVDHHPICTGDAPGMKPSGNNSARMSSHAGSHRSLSFHPDPHLALRDQLFSPMPQIDQSSRSPFGSLLCVGLFATASTVMVASDILIKKTENTPVLDGVADAFWTGVEAVDLARVYVGSSPIDKDSFDPSAKVAWDDNYLYVLFEIGDNFFVVDSPANNGWQDDSVQIYLDGDNAKAQSYDANDVNLLFRRSPEIQVEGVPDGSTYAAEGAISWAVGERDGGYTVEVAIAWSAIGQTPVAGLLFGLDYQANDDDGANPDYAVKWFDPVGNGYANPSVFAEAELSAEVIIPTADVVYRKTSDAIQIDGKPDPVWGQVSAWSLDQLVLVDSIDPSDLSATVRALWDDNYLYYLFQVKDDVAINDDTEAWQDDGVQVYFDADNSKGDTYDANDDAIILRRSDTLTPQGGDGKPYADYITWAVQEKDDGYTLEVAIAWTPFGFTPTEGTVFGVDLQVNDDDDGGFPDAVLKLFDTVGTGYAHPNLFGTAILRTSTVSNQEYLGYSIDDFWIDANDWLGPLEVSYAPWVISAETGGWLYLSESSVSETGGWVFYLK